MMMWDMGWGAGMMVVMSLVWLVVVAGIVAGVVLLVRALSGRRTSGDDAGRRAMTILDERYARGDIDREEYESRRRLLT